MRSGSATGSIGAMDAVAQSLDLFAARCGDPAPLVYARLFAVHPDAAAHFVMDPGGHVRGQMLAVAFEALLDEAEGAGRLAGLVGIERMNHVNIGVAPDQFDGFFALLRDTVRDALGPDWTPAMEAGWAARIAALGQA